MSLLLRTIRLLVRPQQQPGAGLVLPLDALRPQALGVVPEERAWKRRDQPRLERDRLLNLPLPTRGRVMTSRSWRRPSLREGACRPGAWSQRDGAGRGDLRWRDSDAGADPAADTDHSAYADPARSDGAPSRCRDEAGQRRYSDGEVARIWPRPSGGGATTGVAAGRRPVQLRRSAGPTPLRLASDRDQPHPAMAAAPIRGVLNAWAYKRSGGSVSKRMTVIFEDEGLYTALKVAAARSGRPAKDIVAQAVREWLEAKENEELRAELDEARREWEREGGRDSSRRCARAMPAASGRQSADRAASGAPHPTADRAWPPSTTSWQTASG